MIAKTKTAWSQHLTWEYANTRTQGFHPSGNQEVMFLSRIILPWWRHHVTCPRDRSRIVTLTVVLPRYTYYSSQLSTHSEYNLGSKCVCRCERSRFPRCSQTTGTCSSPAVVLQNNTRTPACSAECCMQCCDCGAVTTSYSVTAAEKLSRQKSVATTISSA